MPATYTYNDAIDDARGAVFRAIDVKIKPLDERQAKDYIDLMLAIGIELDRLKRPSRRRGVPDQKATKPKDPLAKIVDADRPTRYRKS